MSYKAHNSILLSASLLVILVSFMITITQGAEYVTTAATVTETCSSTVAGDSTMIDQTTGQVCQDPLSTPEFLTILMLGLGLAGIGFAVRRLSNGASAH